MRTAPSGAVQSGPGFSFQRRRARSETGSGGQRQAGDTEGSGRTKMFLDKENNAVKEAQSDTV